MPIPNDVLAIARSQLNYVESGGAGGDSGNITKYWAEMSPGLQGQPWCAGFVSWVFKHAGATLPPCPYNWGYSYCPSLVSLARQKGWVIPGPKPGAIALYYFGHTEAQHTGICVSGDLGGHFTAIEGNTSPGTAGSQTNGGGVYQRDRSTTGVVFVWPPVYTNAPTEENDLTPEDRKLLFDTLGNIARMVEAIFGAEGRAEDPAPNTVIEQKLDAILAKLG